MVRLLPVLLLFPLVLGAQDLGRTDGLWRQYLSETVRRGLPLVADPDPGVVPFWPALDRLRAEATSLEPGADVELLGAWMDLQEGAPEPAVRALQKSWPRPPLSRLSPRRWGESLFAAWEPGPDPQAWTEAWLAWEDKAYSPSTLVRGLEVLEKSDASAVEPLLNQATQLYPEDRRFLPLLVRHPAMAVSAQGLVARDRVNGGWSPQALAALLSRQPSVRELLVAAGYTETRLDAAQARDYGRWLGTTAMPADGTWSWDSDLDGRSESRITFQEGRLVTWSRRSADGGLWSLGFVAGKPSTVTESRGGAVWRLRYEAYPFVQTLEYQWSNRTLVYRFRPLTQSVPLWPAERFSAAPERLPAALAALWMPLDARSLALTAATVESWESDVKTRTVFLFGGEVWLVVEDINADGRDDRWSYFRSGNLASVYQDVEGRGDVGLRELYRKGELAQVQSRSSAGRRAEFVLFPAEGVQLWDPRGTGRPLDRIFSWSGPARLDALVFAGSSLPWETMPLWEPRP